MGTECGRLFVDIPLLEETIDIISRLCNRYGEDVSLFDLQSIRNRLRMVIEDSK